MLDRLLQKNLTEINSINDFTKTGNYEMSLDNVSLSPNDLNNSISFNIPMLPGIYRMTGCVTFKDLSGSVDLEMSLYDNWYPALLLFTSTVTSTNSKNSTVNMNYLLNNPYSIKTYVIKLTALNATNSCQLLQNGTNITYERL